MIEARTPRRRAKPNCPDCRGFGFIVQPDAGSGSATRCPCWMAPNDRRELAETERLEALAERLEREVGS